MIKRLLCKDNFEIWHKYNKIDSAVSELRGFIEAGILDACPDIFVKRFSEAETLCEDFYLSIKTAVRAKNEIRFNVDFKSGIYDITPDEGEFNPRAYLLNTLDLYPEYRKRVEELTHGAAYV